MNDVELHIERLILDGVPIGSGDAAIVQSVVEAELARLISAEGLSSSVLSGGAHSVLRGSTVRASAATGPREWGTQIARAVHSGLGSPAKP